MEVLRSNNGTDATHQAVLLEACRIFGINPDVEAQPLELAGWRGVGSVDLLEPLAVVLVTAGGLKLRWPLDAESEDRLRRVFNRFKIDKQTGHVTPLPLPEDLTLPAPARNGLVMPQV
jgi:hypothetical protein